MANYRILIFLPLLSFLSGCPVFQPQETPVAPNLVHSDKADREYWIYVPSTYTADRPWPLVITFHGTYGFDSDKDQMDEWKALAEQKGFIVVSPHMKSVQGILPTVRDLFYADLADDEKAVKAIIDEVSAKYNIATVPVEPPKAKRKKKPVASATSAPATRKAILLTGFSAGGYPMYYIGLRNPQLCTMLVARSCNSDIHMMDNIELTEEARELPIIIIWGRDDTAVVKYSWQAVEWLSNHNFKNVVHVKPAGGHLRRPELAYQYWKKTLPRELWPQDEQP